MDTLYSDYIELRQNRRHDKMMTVAEEIPYGEGEIQCHQVDMAEDEGSGIDMVK